MRIRQMVIQSAAIAAMLFSGCSKSSSPQPQAAAPTTGLATVLELSTKTPTHVAIDSSHDCTITTTTIPGGQLLLRMDYKSAGADKPTPLAKLVLNPGQEFTIKTEFMAAPLRFKAELKAE